MDKGTSRLHKNQNTSVSGSFFSPWPTESLVASHWTQFTHLRPGAVASGPFYWESLQNTSKGLVLEAMGSERFVSTPTTSTHKAAQPEPGATSMPWTY